MTVPPRPWWSSDEPDGTPTSDPQLDPDVDPVEAHRAARRATRWPEPDVDDPAVVDGADDPRDDGPADDARDAPPAGEAHHPDICGVCPICVTARFLGDTRPELLEHLTEAARHLAAALRAAVEPPPPSSDDEPTPAGPDGPRRVRRIDLD